MTLTLGDVLDAMERDRLPKARFVFVMYDNEGGVFAACAIGGAAVVLGVNELDLSDALTDFPVCRGILRAGDSVDLSDQISIINDHTWLHKSTIARKIRESGCYDLSTPLAL